MVASWCRTPALVRIEISCGDSRWVRCVDVCVFLRDAARDRENVRVPYWSHTTLLPSTAEGFFVGFFMLVWVWMPTVPHKQKLGILTGYSFHLALGMLKGDKHSDDGGYNDDGMAN